MINKILFFIASKTPRKLLYFMVIQAFAVASTEEYTELTPGEITWDMVCQYLEK